MVETSGPLPWAEVATIGVELAAALAAAHRHDIVHRDIKPANVFVGDDGQVALGDFGIAGASPAPPRPARCGHGEPRSRSARGAQQPATDREVRHLLTRLDAVRALDRLTRVPSMRPTRSWRRC